jgi:ABC-type branched-subunit amino acid transport system substrate-binding protein
VLCDDSVTHFAIAKVALHVSNTMCAEIRELSSRFLVLDIFVLTFCVLTARCDLDVPDMTSLKNVVVAHEGDVNVGYFASVHYNGVGNCDMLSQTGCGAFQTLKFAVNDVNANSVLLPNITVGYVALDDCDSPIRALEVAIYMVSDSGSIVNVDSWSGYPTSQLKHYNVFGVVGPLTSQSASLESSFLSIFRIPQIGIQPTSDSLSDRTLYKYFLRLVSPDSFQIRALLDLCQHFGWSYVSMVYSDGAYGDNAVSQVDRFLRDSSKGYNICLAATVKIPAEAQQTDINQAVNQLLAYPSARAVLLFLSGAHAGPFFSAAEAIAGPGKFMWLVGDYLGFFTSPPFSGIVEGGIYVDHSGNPVPSLSNYIRGLTPWDYSNDIWLSEQWEAAFQCSVAGDNGEVRCPRNASINDNVCPVYDQVSGRIYDAVHVLADALHRLISDNCPEAFQNKSVLRHCIQGPMMLKYIHNTSMDGIIGKIVFDSDGNMLENLLIKQYQKVNSQYVTTIVGTWNAINAKLNVSKELFKFSNFEPDEITGNSTLLGDVITSVCSVPCQSNEYIIRGEVTCCWTCRTCRDNEIVAANRTACQACPTFYWPDDNGTWCNSIEPTFLHGSHPISVCLLVMAALGATLGFCCIVIYVKKRHNRLVMATCLPLSSTILVGTLVAVIAIILLVIHPQSSNVCRARNFGFHCGVNLIYSPLFVKNVLIYRIFSAGAHKVACTSTKFQMTITLLIIILQVNILKQQNTLEDNLRDQEAKRHSL